MNSATNEEMQREKMDFFLAASLIGFFMALIWILGDIDARLDALESMRDDALQAPVEITP